MSRRFGRQQKRKMLAQLGEQEKEIQTLVELVTTARRETREYARTVGKTAAILGTYFAGLPAGTIDTELAALPGWWRMVPKNAPVFPGGSLAKDMSQIIENMTVIKTDVHRDFLSRAMHVRITARDGEWAYCVSDNMLKTIPPEEIAIGISKELTRMMISSKEFQVK